MIFAGINKVVHRTNTGNFYKCIPIHAVFGIHEGVLEIVNNKLERGSKVIDIAAGSGAFTQRLMDAGYDVSANELDLSDWKLNNITPMSIDLNDELSENTIGLFDAVIGIEVIEHLENPRLFLNNCIKLLKPNGLIVVTTPNITARCSRIRFLRTGEFFHFSTKTAFDTGHITPIPLWLMKIHAEIVGLNFEFVKGLGQYPGLYESLLISIKKSFQEFNWKPIGASLTETFLSFIVKDSFDGDKKSICYAIVLSKRT